MPEETVGAADLAACDCAPCARKAGRDTSIRPGVIHAYSSTPRGGWRPRLARTEAADAVSAPTFGIELETSVATFRPTELPGRPAFYWAEAYDATPEQVAEAQRLRNERTRWVAANQRHIDRQLARHAAEAGVNAHEAVSLASPRGLWHAKHDGSVSGPEFASQPGTLAYWRSIRPTVTSMFRALLHGGVRSHDGDTCGMHVNIGSDAFGDLSATIVAGHRPGADDHLERFMALIGENTRWATRMAMRTHQSQAAWASYYAIENERDRHTLARAWASYGYASTDHCSAVNLAHRGRVEFRLPRGTLRIDRFYAKLEWVAAMVEYTRNPESTSRVADFIRYVTASGEYPELVRFMRERFPARFS